MLECLQTIDKNGSCFSGQYEFVLDAIECAFSCYYARNDSI